jgi:hypothetical protein
MGTPKESSSVCSWRDVNTITMVYTIQVTNHKIISRKEKATILRFEVLTAVNMNLVVLSKNLVPSFLW